MLLNICWFLFGVVFGIFGFLSMMTSIMNEIENKERAAKAAALFGKTETTESEKSSVTPKE